MTSGTAMRGSRVVITGGGSGIGRTMALEAASRGASVVIWDRDLGAAQAVVAELDAVKSAGASSNAPLAADSASSTTATSKPAVHSRHLAIEVDVTDTAAVAAAAAESGAVDVVINNAGVVNGKPLLDLSEEGIRRTFEVNTLAPYWVTRSVLPGMIERNRGTVVTIASAGALVGVARQTDYSASKFAAFGFTESLRNELRMTGSRVGTLTVCPYYIDTGMFDGVKTKFAWLLPILDQQYVARRTIDAIERGRVQLVMPRFARVVQWARILPTRAFDRLVEFFGVQDTMTSFRGRG